MKLESFDDQARSDQLLDLILERKADQVFVLKLLLSESTRTATVNKLVETLSPFLDANAAIDGVTASGAAKRRGSKLLLTERGKRFMTSFDTAHERYMRDRALWTEEQSRFVPTLERRTLQQVAGWRMLQQLAGRATLQQLEHVAHAYVGHLEVFSLVVCSANGGALELIEDLRHMRESLSAGRTVRHAIWCMNNGVNEWVVSLTTRAEGLEFEGNGRTSTWFESWEAHGTIPPAYHLGGAYQARNRIVGVRHEGRNRARILTDLAAHAVGHREPDLRATLRVRL